MKNIKILVATHKKTWMPESDIYLPIQVGKTFTDELFGYQTDDMGDNISEKNREYCELTALYWAWKNLGADYIGLVHYGRMFSGKKKAFEKDPRKCVLQRGELEKLLGKTDVILPKKRRYYIESLYSHYSHTHGEEQLITAKKIISELCPEYEESFDIVMKRKWGYMFNMFIMKKQLFEQYCEWLFPVLEKLEKSIDSTGMTPFEKRYPGRISECLFNVWLEKNKVKYIEQKWIYLRKVNYFKKICSFLSAKLFHKKYKSSF